MTTLTRTERKELSGLLPWYATGALDTADHARVEQALAIDAGLRAELDLVTEDRAAILELVEEEAVPASMAARFDALFEQEESSSRRAAAPRAEVRPSLLERIAVFLAPPRRMAWAAAAAALVIAIQSGAIVSLLADRTGGTGFSTASGPGAAEGIAVLVRFVPERTAGEVGDWLAANNGRISDGPLPGGLYRLRFERSPHEDAAALAKRLSAESTMFALVLPAL